MDGDGRSSQTSSLALSRDSVLSSGSSAPHRLDPTRGQEQRAESRRFDLGGADRSVSGSLSEPVMSGSRDSGYDSSRHRIVESRSHSSR